MKYVLTPDELEEIIHATAIVRNAYRRDAMELESEGLPTLAREERRRCGVLQSGVEKMAAAHRSGGGLSVK